MDMKKINMVNDAAVERVIALRKSFNETLTNQTSTKNGVFFICTPRILKIISINKNQISEECIIILSNSIL